MNKNLPKVFANPIEKEIHNNKDIFYGNDRNINLIKEDIPRKINEIFSSVHHVYKSKVRIGLNNDLIDAVIVGKTNNNLLTINGEKININDIKSIEKI